MNDAQHQLKTFFLRNGHHRKQNDERLQAEGAQRYKKSDEIRLTANSENELAIILALLNQLKFKPGKPFPHHTQFRIPLYGREQVLRFLQIVNM